MAARTLKAETEPNGTGTLSVKQEEVAVELARGQSYQQAAKTTKAGLTTIKVWASTNPAFKARVAELRAEMTECVFGLIVDAMAAAVGTMVALMKSKQEGMRHKAAESMMSHYAHAVELRDLKTRLEAIEANQVEGNR